MKWIIVAVSLLLATPALADDARCQRNYRYVNSKCPDLLTGLSCKDTPDKVQAAYDQCHDGGAKAPAPPKDSSKDTKDTKDARVRCTVTRVANRDTSIDIPLSSKMFAETECRDHVRSAAEKWLVANAKCDPGKTVFPYTFTFGPAGKETTFNHSGYCPTK